MQPISLFLLTTAVLFSSALSMPTEEPQTPTEPLTDSLAPGEPLMVTVDGISYTVTNGSTLADILNELHPGSRVERSHSGCSFSAGTFGGAGGYAFNEHPGSCNAIIKTIKIRAALYVDGIQLTYRLSNGQDFVGTHYGGQGGNLRVFNVDVNAGERVIGVVGRSASLVDQLGFVTNHGRIFGPHGGCGGNRFYVYGCQVRGMFGRSALLLDSIGFFCSGV